MIKIVKGKYGYKDGKITVLKDSNSDPFELDKEEEARLVEEGIAEYTEGGENPPSGDGKTPYDASMKMDVLKEIASKEYNVPAEALDACRSRQAIVDLIDAAKADAEQDEDEEGEEAGSEGGENPPLGDAAEAVQ